MESSKGFFRGSGVFSMCGDQVVLPSSHGHRTVYGFWWGETMRIIQHCGISQVAWPVKELTFNILLMVQKSGDHQLR